MCNKYNGYSNYFTWNIALWLDKNESSYNHVREMRDSIVRDPSELDHGYLLASKLEELVKDINNPLVYNTSMYADILFYCLSSVNWIEIADNILEKVEA